MATKRKADELQGINTAVLKYLQENNLADTAKTFAKEAKLKGVSTSEAVDLGALYNNYLQKETVTPATKKAKIDVPTVFKAVPMEEDSSSSSSSDSDSDDEKEKPPKTIVTVTVGKKKAPSSSSSSSSSDDSSDDSSSEDEKPSKPVPAKVAAKPASKAPSSSSSSSSEDSSDDDSSDDEKPAAKSTPAAVAKKAASSSSSSSEDSSDDSSSDEEKVKPVQPTKVNKVNSSSTSSSSSSSSDDSSSESEDEKPAPVAAKKAAAAAPKKKEESSSNSSSSESSDDSSSSSDEEEEKPVIKNNKNTPAKNAPAAAVTPKASDNNGNVHKIYVKGLPWQATEEEVSEFFQQCGTIVSCELPLDENGRSSGTAYVKFGSRAELDAALALDGQNWKDTTRWLRIVESSDKQDRKSFGGPVGERPEGCDTVFVGNLPWDVDEDAMRTLFSEAGEVSSVRFATSEDGSFRGFGHVQFYNGEDTVKAIKLAGRQINGRAIRVDYAPPRNRESLGGAKSPGRGRGGGRGGFEGGRGGRGGGRGGGITPAKKNTGMAVGGSGKKTTFDD